SIAVLTPPIRSCIGVSHVDSIGKPVPGLNSRAVLYAVGIVTVVTAPESVANWVVIGLSWIE
ncbi:MAG: hypothetical protein JSU63_07655, partial [Phycisphaerales bacterium]